MRVAVTAVVVALMGGGGCRDAGEGRRTAGGPVLAKIGDRDITAADVAARLAAEPQFVQLRYARPEKRRELLENLVRFEVMAAEARRRGYETDHLVRRAEAERAVAALIRTRFDERMRPEDIPEAELAAHLAAHAGDFDEVRASQIVVRDGARAAALAAQARALAPNDEAGFRALVMAHSEDEDSKPRGGDLTYFGRDTDALPKEIVKAAFGLEKPGDVAGPLETDAGHHVLRLTGSRPGRTRTLADAHLRKAVAARVLASLRARAIDGWVAEMRARLKVVVDEAKLAAIEP